MEGIVNVKKRYLMVSGMVTWAIQQVYPAPWIVAPLSILTTGFIGCAIAIYFHKATIIQNTLNIRVMALEFNSNWPATVRTDRISDTNYKCIYRVWYSVSHDELEKVTEGNTITYTGDKIRVQDEVKVADIFLNWIGKNGEELDPNIWKNTIAKMIKTRNGGRISVLHIGYLKQVQI